MLSSAERRKLYVGIEIAKRCPSISLLFFADDSLFFFCRATTLDCQQMATILQNYEWILGQKINYV